MIDPVDVTGLILAGGRGSRMGGVDKGLQTYRDVPLALHAVLKLGPQVGDLLINANRNLSAYESFGPPIWSDTLPDFAGPLAGFLTGLEQVQTPWLMTVPCDSPHFPDDLVVRLSEACSNADADLAIAATMEDGQLQRHPVFCLMRATLLESLTRFTQAGGRKIDAWTGSVKHTVVTFPDAAAFFNANTLHELQQLQ